MWQKNLHRTWYFFQKWVQPWWNLFLEKIGQKCTEKEEKKIKIWANIHFLQVLGKAGADNEEPSNFASPGPVCGYKLYILPVLDLTWMISCFGCMVLCKNCIFGIYIIQSIYCMNKCFGCVILWTCLMKRRRYIFDWMIKCFEPACWDVAEPMDGRVLQKLLQALHLWIDYYSLHQNAPFEN